MKPIPADDPRIAALAARCKAVKNGISAASIMAETGMSMCLTLLVLRRCKQQGLLMMFKVPGGTIQWMSRDDGAAIAALPENARLMKRRSQKKSLYDRRRSPENLDHDGRLIIDSTWNINRRYVKAGAVPPPVTYAVNSVFALGAE